MDKNSVIGMIIIAVMIVAYSIYTQPSEEQLEAQRLEQVRIEDSLARVAMEKERQMAEMSQQQALPSVTRQLPDSALQYQMDAQAIQAFGDLAPATKGTPQKIVVENDKFIVNLSTQGGVIQSIELKDYKTYDSLPLMLADAVRSMQDFSFSYPGIGTIAFTDLVFESNKTALKLSGEDRAELVLTARGAQPGQELIMRYNLQGNSYELNLKVESKGFNGFDNFNTQPLALMWSVDGPKTEKYLPWQRNISTFFYKYFNDDRDWLSETKEDELNLENAASWVAFKQGFFSIVVFSRSGFIPGASNLAITPFDEDETGYTKNFKANMALPVAGGTTEVKYFFGPNELETLEVYGDDLARIINYGWSFIGWINRHVIFHLYNWFIDWGLGAGIAILFLTIVIKMVLAPLMLKNYKSSAKMRVLKPEVDKINKKFEGKDATQKQQAIMGLYRETGVNPLSGCLPMLIQMPVLYAMFRFFPSSIELRGVNFLWADDLSSYDSILNLGFNIPLYGDHISLFTLLMAGTTLTYTWMSSGNMPDTSQPGMPNMKVMMYIFPVMMIFFFNSYSSGLTYYYFVSTLISILQMWVIKEYFIDEERILAKLEANKAKPKKKSKFQARLEEMARQQQQTKKR